MTIASNTIFVYSSYSVEEEKYHYAIICNNDETAVPVDIYLIITLQICAYNLHEFGGHAHCSPLLSPQLSLQRTIYREMNYKRSNSKTFVSIFISN